MKTSDVIIALDDREVSSVLELRKYLYNEKQIGDKMRITYYRNGKLSTVDILLSENDEG